MSSRRSSGSSRAESAVEPTRSTNITVSCRRSAPTVGTVSAMATVSRAPRWAGQVRLRPQGRAALSSLLRSPSEMPSFSRSASVSSGRTSGRRRCRGMHARTARGPGRAASPRCPPARLPRARPGMIREPTPIPPEHTMIRHAPARRGRGSPARPTAFLGVRAVSFVARLEFDLLAALQRHRVQVLLPLALLGQADLAAIEPAAMTAVLGRGHVTEGVGAES